MTPSRSVFQSRLIAAPTCSVTGIFVRRVAKAAFDRGRPPSYLYTSGAANRLNPKGVHALYLSEDEATALREQEAAWGELAELLEPTVVFRTRVALARVLDLHDPATLEHLGLRPSTLSRPWVLAKAPTRLQHLGRAVASQSRLAAALYPSAARARIGETGRNLVVYRNALEPPDRVEILGPRGKIVEAWP